MSKQKCQKMLKKELECSDHKMNVIKELNKDICNLLAEKEKKEEEIRNMEFGDDDNDINNIRLEIAKLKTDYKLNHGKKKKKKCLKDGEVCEIGDASSDDN
ncbi:hypothetical protein HELRODRAFT_168927 [Helobdella robusta]|uniref:Uncharacterized protein n=1 Tax=Helobdella robusta TaxID=6412 RepID=T1F154_HELRO|nr:hypothetical protein HELRODRAFT_168927 [Helobdella robusta]ESO08997.1 hypothetical protein HELRODRAFT_168927 [Helobdella robusta]